MIHPTENFVVLRPAQTAPAEIDSSGNMKWNLDSTQEIYVIDSIPSGGDGLQVGVKVLLKKLGSDAVPFTTYEHQGMTYKIVPREAIIAWIE